MREAEGGAVFFVAEGRAEAEEAKNGEPAARILQGKFAFDFDFIAHGTLRRDRYLGREERARTPRGDEPDWRRGFDADAKEAAETVKERTRCVVKGVQLEDAAAADGAEAAEPFEQGRSIRDAEFHFNFVMGERGHSRKEYI